MGSGGKTDFDAIVVGAGPNGLAAAIAIQREGFSVLLLEAKDRVGGGMRSAALTLPGYMHDICSAIHPLAADSPFFSRLPLGEHGLKYLYPSVPAAHPLEDGRAAVLRGPVEETAQTLGADGGAYRSLLEASTADWPLIAADVLGPLHIPADPVRMARFGWKAMQPATELAKQFSTDEARGLWAGMAAHSMLPLTKAATSAIAMVLLIAGHRKGWPLPEGGTQRMADALEAYFISLGGKIETGVEVTSLGQLPSAKAVLLDLTPRQLLRIGGHRWSTLYEYQLRNYRYGLGVFKMDWALEAPIPFVHEGVRGAGVVHIGGRLEEIVASEEGTWKGGHPERPFVLLAQPSLFDGSRAPAGRHTAWAYCHVPHGSRRDMTEAIEKQVERFAPGFRERILARHTMDTAQMESYNANYVGGDINGGAICLDQLFTRPAIRLSPYRTSEKGIYICSSSTPPGGGVHGMCGYHAARRALRDVFHVR